MGADSKLGLGIDIGTTFTAAAVALPDDRVEALPLGEAGPPVPTALFLQPPGLLVGEPAIRRGQSEPESLTREFKRRFGDTAPVELASGAYWVEYLYGILLEWVVGKATEHLGARPDSVVVSHPAAWGQYKLELLTEACQRAGIPEALSFSEPSCVAFQYAAHASLPIGGHIGVYDFGGGTFDAAIVHRTTTGFDITGRPAGLEQAGGIDVDRAIFDMVLDRSPELARTIDAGGDDPGAAAIVTHVRAACVDAKHGLSSDTVATVPVMLPSGPGAVNITRAELESAIRPLLEDTLNTFDRALSSAGIPVSDLQAIVLAGGSSRIPLVGQLIKTRYHRPLAVDLHPKLTVAYGAASKAVHERSRSRLTRSFPPTGPNAVVRSYARPMTNGSTNGTKPHTIDGGVPAAPVRDAPRPAAFDAAAPAAAAAPSVPTSTPAGRGVPRTGRPPAGFAGPRSVASVRGDQTEALAAPGRYLEERKEPRRADLPVILASILLLAGAFAGGLYLTERRHNSSTAATSATAASASAAPSSSSTTTSVPGPTTTMPAAVLRFPPKPLASENGLAVLDAGFSSYLDSAAGGQARKVSWAVVFKNTFTAKTIKAGQVNFQLLDSAGNAVGSGKVTVANLAPGAMAAASSDATKVTGKPAKMKVVSITGVDPEMTKPPAGGITASGAQVSSGAANTVSVAGTVSNQYGFDVTGLKANVVIENASGAIVCGGVAPIGDIASGQSGSYQLSLGCADPGPYVAVAFVDIPAEAAGTSAAS